MPDKPIDDCCKRSDPNSKEFWSEVSRKISADAMSQYIEKNLARMDKDKNGFLSISELQTAESAATNMNDKVMLDKTIANYGAIARSELKYSNFIAQISPSSAARFAQESAQVTKEALALKRAIRFAKVDFEEIDSDHNGYLTKCELTNATEPESKLLISHVKDAQIASDDEWDYEDSGISKRDLDKYFAQWAEETHSSFRADPASEWKTFLDGGYSLQREQFLFNRKRKY